MPVSPRRSPRPRTPARRQVLATIDQCVTWAGAPGSGGWFGGLAEQRAGLEPLAVAAGEALRELGVWLRERVAPIADPVDGVGEERYLRAARTMLGIDLDPREAYDWAWVELRRLEAEMRATIEQITPGASLVEVKTQLDEATAIEGADRWRNWLQDLTDQTTEQLQGTYFDIDPKLLRCEAMLPPVGVAAAPYYSAPSEDFRVPGRTWYPTLGRERLPTWDITTTVFHEAVPGHHLQVGRVQDARRSPVPLSPQQRLQRAHRGLGALRRTADGRARRLRDNLAGRLGFLSLQMLRPHVSSSISGCTSATRSRPTKTTTARCGPPRWPAR